MPRWGQLKLFTGNANPQLAERIAQYLEMQLGDIPVSKHVDGEVYQRFEEEVRGCHVVIIQPTNAPDTHQRELTLMGNAARAASAALVTGVISYLGYSRQDRKDRPRTAIAARLAVDEIVNAGFQRVIVPDLHAEQIQGFFDPKFCIMEYLYARPVFVSLFRHLGLTGFVNGPPDVGRARTAQAYLRRLGGGMYFAVKGDDQVRDTGHIEIIGDVKGRPCRIIDDEVESGGTLVNTAIALAERGAGPIHAVVTHGKLVGPAIDRIAASPIEKLFIGDTIQLPARAREVFGDRLCHVTFAPLLAEAVLRLHEDRSISALFNDEEVSRFYNGNYFINT